MTLGPALVALAAFDRPLGRWARPVVTFGRVPLFFYVLHLPLIHLAAVGCDWARFGWSPQADAGPWVVQPSFPQVYVHCARDGLSVFDLPRSRGEQDWDEWRPLTRWVGRQATQRG